jgi:hypothetical protein
MTRKDSCLIAGAIQETVRELGALDAIDAAQVERVLIAEFQRALATTNSRFDRQRFAVACEVAR